MTKCLKMVGLGALSIALLISLIFGFGCAKQEATPTPPPSPTPTPTPKMEIVIYSDFQCHNCADLFFDVEEELHRLYVDTDKVSMEVRSINGLGNASLLAAEAALCAGDQGKFWAYSGALFTAWRQAGAAAYSEAELLKTAIALGLNEEAFSTCLTSGVKEAEVDANRLELLDAGETEIPIIYINGNKIKGNKPLQTYVDVIEQLLSQ